MRLVSAYIPCYNNASTLALTIHSIQLQTYPVNEILVIDDGSTDGSKLVAETTGVRVVEHTKNLGRGATRARAMIEVQGELVVCCDATNVLSPDFIERAIRWLEEDKVAAVFGCLSQVPVRGAVGRWRGRHLFKIGSPGTPINRSASLATYGALVRRSVVLQTGNYTETLRHSEDADLGERLLTTGYDVICDPSLQVTSVVCNTLGQVLERYWRWYAGKDELVSWNAYLKQVLYSVKVMAVQDLRAGDPLSVPISLLCPHYQFWKSWWRQYASKSS